MQVKKKLKLMKDELKLIAQKQKIIERTTNKQSQKAKNNTTKSGSIIRGGGNC